VELSLQEEEDKIDGQLTEMNVGKEFSLVQIERSGDRLKFVIPIGGEGDSENVVFELQIEGNHMVGHCREMHDGSVIWPTTFTKKAG